MMESLKRSIWLLFSRYEADCCCPHLIEMTEIFLTFSFLDHRVFIFTTGLAAVAALDTQSDECLMLFAEFMWALIFESIIWCRVFIRVRQSNCHFIECFVVLTASANEWIFLQIFLEKLFCRELYLCLWFKPCCLENSCR